uniref:hypothetical protein n=1 Tax=Streptosporangium sp. CA-256172 TaxID=3240076 RepID=UPI003F493F75
MPPERKPQRDLKKVAQQTASHAVPDLAAPQPIVVSPIEPPVDPAIADPHARTLAAVPELPAPEREERGQREQEERARQEEQREREEKEKREQELADQERERAGRERQEVPRAKRNSSSKKRVLVQPTTTADCKGDSRRKHTINVASDVHRRLLGLQLAETMAAGRERPLWRHIDAALAVLRADELNAGDLAVWGERAEAYAELFGDDYRQIGTLLRASVLTAVRTLRVRLRAAGVTDVDAQAVLSAALAVYLDALVAQGDLVEQE